jgi:hypothetical protein
MSLPQIGGRTRARATESLSNVTRTDSPDRTLMRTRSTSAGTATLTGVVSSSRPVESAPAIDARAGVDCSTTVAGRPSMPSMRITMHGFAQG